MTDDDTPARGAPMHPDDVLTRFGREVRIAREARALSRPRFAKRCGLSVSTVKSLESGRGAHPRLETMVRLANGLGVSLIDLLACVDPRLTDEHKAKVGSAHVWLATLGQPEQELVLALVRVLARNPTHAAEAVVYMPSSPGITRLDEFISAAPACQGSLPIASWARGSDTTPAH